MNWNYQNGRSASIGDTLETTVEPIITGRLVKFMTSVEHAGKAMVILPAGGSTLVTVAGCLHEADAQKKQDILKAGFTPLEPAPEPVPAEVAAGPAVFEPLPEAGPVETEPKVSEPLPQLSDAA